MWSMRIPRACPAPAPYRPHPPAGVGLLEGTDNFALSPENSDVICRPAYSLEGAPRVLADVLTEDPFMELIRKTCAPMRASLVPEFQFWGAAEGTALRGATEETLEHLGIAAPFWAFAWPGGQALARYILDHASDLVSKRVVALASGAGLEALAAARAGAASVLAIDIDPVAVEAARMNAALNGLQIGVACGDVRGAEIVALCRERADIILVGDAFYDSEIAPALTGVLQGALDSGCSVLVGDPGRSHPCPLPSRHLADYTARTDRDLEGVVETRVSVRALTTLPGGPADVQPTRDH